MALNSPQRYTSRGLTFEITGRPGVSRTRIRLLYQGRYGRVLRENPTIWTTAAGLMAQYLRENMPVDTGMMVASVRVENPGRIPIVTFGPNAYNRAKLKAQQAGRVYKPRKQNPKKSKNYGLWANDTSFNAGFIEDAINRTAAEIVRIAEQVEDAQQAQQELFGQMRRIR